MSWCLWAHPVQDVLDFAQCDMERAKKVLYGGPMMGIAVPDTADPILKANNAVLALEKFVSPKPTACIHCGRCVHACPLRLMPTEIAKWRSGRRTAKHWAN